MAMAVSRKRGQSSWAMIVKLRRWNSLGWRSNAMYASSSNGFSHSGSSAELRVSKSRMPRSIFSAMSRRLCRMMFPPMVYRLKLMVPAVEVAAAPMTATLALRSALVKAKMLATLVRLSMLR